MLTATVYTFGLYPVEAARCPMVYTAAKVRRLGLGAASPPGVDGSMQYG